MSGADILVGIPRADELNHHAKRRVRRRFRGVERFVDEAASLTPMDLHTGFTKWEWLQLSPENRQTYLLAVLVAREHRNRDAA